MPGSAESQREAITQSASGHRWQTKLRQSPQLNLVNYKSARSSVKIKTKKMGDFIERVPEDWSAALNIITIEAISQITPASCTRYCP